MANQLLQELAIALQTNEMISYLDRDNLEIIAFPENPAEDTPEVKEERSQVAQQGEKFILIEIVQTWRLFKLRQNFVKAIADDNARDHLFRALKSDRPFHNFRTVLNYFPPVLELWYKTEENYFYEAAEKWFETHINHAE